MAVTKIWKVKDRLDSTIHYAVNGEKTEEKLYVSGINCMPDTSYQEMINVKKQFFKTDGIQCFHAVQSFVKGEVTPKQAHEIGVQLAEEIWGDKFQVVITTHLNTDNIHNHFVINSISFIDGKRFCNTKKDYAIMRNTSDKLCEEYGLNILKHEKQTDRYNKFATSSLYKELMRDSIDYAVANAKDYNEFIKILQDLDYVITDKNETLSIRGEPYKRNTRIEGTVLLSCAKQLKNSKNTNSREPIPDGAGITPASIYATAISMILCVIVSNPVPYSIYAGIV